MDFSNEYFSNLNQQKRFSADEETLDNMVKRQRLQQQQQQQQQYGQLPSASTPSQVSPSQVDSDSLLGQSDAFSSFNFQPYTPSNQQNFSFPFRGPSMLPPPMHNLMQQSQPGMESLTQTTLNPQQQQQQQQQQLNYMFFQQQPPFFSTQRSSYPNLGQFNSSLGMGGQPSSTTIAPITAPVLTMESPLPEEPTPNYQSIYKYNPPQPIPSTIPAAAKKPKRGSDPMKKKEGLEESSVRIIGLLQTRGKMIFKDIHETLNIDYRRAYDILNILLTTTLITKVGKKRENKLPFIYQDGTPLPEPVEIRDIMNDIQREEELNATLKQRIALLEEELNKEDPNFKGLKDRDPLLQSDPLYKDLV